MQNLQECCRPGDDVPLVMGCFGLVFSLLLFATPLWAEGDFTEGYDENTEITVRGVIMDAGRETRGPLILRVQHAGRTYLIVTAPPWYLMQESALYGKGMEIEARGSKYFGNDGNVYLLAKEIRDMPGGRVTVMRDKQYRPLWHGRRMPARGGEQRPAR